MTYTNTWSESAPLGSALASTLDELIRQAKLDIRERLASSSANFNAGTLAAETLTIANGLTVTAGDLTLTAGGLVGKVAPRGYIFGMVLSNGTDYTNDIDVTAGECSSDDAAATSRVLLSPGLMTKRLDAEWAAGSNAGGRIAGESLVNGTWYVYAFRRTGGTDDICFSQSLSPTLPDSGTKKRRIGAILRESATIIQFNQRGDEFWRETPITDFSDIPASANAINRTLSVPTGIRVQAIIRASIDGCSSATEILFTDPDNDDAAPGYGAGQAGAAAEGFSVAEVRVWTSTSRVVRSRIGSVAGDPNLTIYTCGWVDLRGRTE